MTPSNGSPEVLIPEKKTVDRSGIPDTISIKVSGFADLYCVGESIARSRT